MSNFIQKGISIPKVLFLIFTLIVGFTLSSQAQLLAENPNPPAQASDEVSTNFIGTVLWDQFDATIGGGSASQVFPDFSNSVLQSADDFEVPMGETWSIEEVLTRGSFSQSGPIPSVNVIFYENDGGMPGSIIAACNYLGLVPANGADPDISVLLATPCVLGPGQYWVSVMPVMLFAPNGQWFWSSVNFTALNEWQFQDPDGLIPNPCVTWGAGNTACGIAGSDKQFQLLGEIVNPLELDPITPAIKNNINSMSVSGATPGSPVAFVWGFQTGTLIVGGHICGGTELGINPIQLLGTATAELDGTADFMFFIPSLGGVNLVYTQAVDIDTCNVSEVVENILQND